MSVQKVPGSHEALVRDILVVQRSALSSDGLSNLYFTQSNMYIMY